MGVEDSFRQLVGAERWIRSFPEQIFLDANCTEPLPVRWPVNPIIHRIVVVRGVTDFPAPHGENAPELSISQEVFKETPPLFVAGQLSATQYCHIFDETSLARVLDWLDTATDFIEYLSAKEVRFTGREAHFAASEADYLASYYANVDDRNLHYFLEDDLELKNNLKDSWSRFEGSSSFMAGKIYNANSYLIDRKIEWFTKALQSGEAESGGWSDDPREALGVLASLSRFQRRLFEQKIRGWV